MWGLPAITQAQEVCFPSCDTADGRFLTLATGELLETLADQPISISFAVPADVTAFDIEVFDGDDGAADGDGLTHWDLLTNPTTFTLFADPNGDGSGMTELAVFSSEEMVSNDWFTIPITTGNAAAAPSGNFFYLLEVAPGDPDLVAVNAFKVRSTAPVTLSLRQQVFGFMAAWTRTNSDLPIVYPNYDDSDPLSIDNTVASRFDGSFSFFIDLQLAPGRSEIDELVVWDGDIDRGDFDGQNSDTDDPNTPNDTLPEFDVNQSSRFEGIAVGTDPSTGAPPDDVDPDSQGGFGIYNLRAPSVVYTVTSPGTEAVGTNSNPSGNSEWEQYRIATGPFNPAESDASATRLEAGAYRVDLAGMDMNNLNAWFFGATVLCQTENAEACPPGPRRYRLGDLVWLDPNANQVQDPGEPGIPGVIVRLLRADGTVIATTLTDADGLYGFEVDAGTYTVEIDPPNFDGPSPRGGVGDFVWFDLDRDGAQDAGEPGIPQVEIALLDAGPDGVRRTADDLTLARTQTDVTGFYFFPALDRALYYTAVDDASLPSGLALAGGNDPSEARPIFVDEVHRDLDFGYLGAPGRAGIGDFVWSDLDNDGVQDVGEPGIGGVTLIARSPGDDGIFGTDDDVQAGATTTAGGYYLFGGLEPGTYRVEVTDENGVLTDYLQTAAADDLAVAADEYDLTGDFGYFKSDLNTVSNVVWFDADRDGTRDAGEPGIGGVTVALVDGVGDVLARTITDGDGGILFEGLADGPYGLAITDLGNALAGLLPTTLASVRRNEPFTIAGSDVDGVHFGWVNRGALEGLEPTTESPTQTDTVNDENVLTYDFGYRQPSTGSIGDTIWFDQDGDGSQDPGEPGIPGVSVLLKDDNGNVLGEQVTDSDGNYLFVELPAGTYTVCVDPSTLPGGLVPSGDPDGIPDNETTVLLDAGEDELDADFGYTQLPCEEGDVLDRFDVALYDNNDGSFDWIGPWIEDDPFGGGPTGGLVQIIQPNGWLRLGDRPNSGKEPSIRRPVDLRGNISAKLSYDFVITSGVDPEDAAVVEVSPDGGDSFFALETFNGIAADEPVIGSRIFNISLAVGAELVVRYRVVEGYGDVSEFLYIDNVRVSCGC